MTYSYDAAYGRMASMEDGIGTTTYAYHPITGGANLGAGQLARVDGPWDNDVVTYEYDELRRATRRAINGVAETAAYDPRGRISSIVNPLGTFTYSYVPNTARPASVVHTGGLRTEYEWLPNNQDRRLATIRNLRPNGSAISTFGYTYDATGRIQTWSQQNGSAQAQVWTLGHDDADQLTSVVVREGGAIVKESSWTYDAAANRTTETIDGRTRLFTYNALNEMTRSNTSLPTAKYEWDAENRLTAIIQGASRTEFLYDGSGRRVRVVEKTGTTTDSDQTYLWCGLELCEKRDHTGRYLQQSYFEQGLYDANGAGAYLYAKDHLGSVRELVAPSGVVAERISYDAWGAPTFSNPTPTSAFAFTGHFWHERSGLHLAPYRAYSALQGRWISRDPIGEAGGVNLYGYVLNNPAGLIDPTGEHPLLVLWAVTEIGLQIWEGYETGATLSDPCATLEEKGIAGGLFLVGAVLPGGGYSFLDDAAKAASKTGKSVLGKYPDYIKLADELGAKRFSIPTHIWNKMSKAEQWAANRKFLDRMIARGDDIILSNPVKDLNNVSGAFRQELDYLIEQGFRLSEDGTRLIR